MDNRMSVALLTSKEVVSGERDAETTEEKRVGEREQRL